MKIIHTTSAHSRYDIRIFVKMCKSLADYGNRITLIVADGLGNEKIDGIEIFDVGKEKNRWRRFIYTPLKIYQKLKQLNADIVHMHDPDMLLVGLQIKKLGVKVIFDSHELVRDQILMKHYLPRHIRKFISLFYSIIEKIVCSRLDAIICATQAIDKHFRQFAKRSVVVSNYPIVGELYTYEQKERHSSIIIYAGVITEERGILEFLDALSICKCEVTLKLYGRFGDKKVERSVRDHPNYEKYVEYGGEIGRSELAKEFSTASCGIVTFKPYPNHIEAMPNKLFEYMSAGLPVMASNFPLWQSIITAEDCGLTVDPCSASDIAQKIDHVVSRPDLVQQWGFNGQQAVRDRFNWDKQYKVLCDTYREILFKNA
jgi:glycosyltransferase involved in cell wall biosynthesis